MSRSANVDWSRALVLGIESSCDETAVALVRGGREILAHRVASQTDLHRRFGGVVPEQACRAHMQVLLPEIQALLDDQDVRSDDLDGLAVTNRPGLIGALLTGVSAAKALALAWDLPLVGVNHLESHVTAARVAEPDLSPPFVALIASGGHTGMYLVGPGGTYRRLGGTRDDAAGEAFDKAAAVLDLPYPGGPSIERAARKGNSKAFPWKNACLTSDGRDLSFSGIKTAVLYAARGRQAGRNERLTLDNQGVADAAASFQRAVVHALVTRTLQHAEACGVDWVALCGGVAANRALRASLESEAARMGLRIALPHRELCTDNAAMVAARGTELLAAGVRDGLDLGASARDEPGPDGARGP